MKSASIWFPLTPPKGYTQKDDCAHSAWSSTQTEESFPIEDTNLSFAYFWNLFFDHIMTHGIAVQLWFTRLNVEHSDANVPIMPKKSPQKVKTCLTGSGPPVEGGVNVFSLRTCGNLSHPLHIWAARTDPAKSLTFSGFH